MTKPTLIILAMLLCLWASGSVASRATICYFGSTPQVSISSGTFFWWVGPSLTLAVPMCGAVPLYTPEVGQGEEEAQEPEDPEPSPVRPDLHGDLSGEGQNPPQPPGP